MRYEELEVQGVISAELCHAIANELEISDLLCEPACDEREARIRQCHMVTGEMERQFEEASFERLVMNAVGKKLWVDRVENYVNMGCRSREDHPEYHETMQQQSAECGWRLMSCLNDYEFEVAAQILNDVDLPRQITAGEGLPLAA